MMKRIVCVILSVAFYSLALTQPDGEAPDFTQKDSQGNEVKLSSLKGNPVLIFFYADDCTECRGVLKTILETLKKHSEGGESKKDEKKLVSIGFLYRRDASFNEAQRKKHQDTYGMTFSHYLSFPADFGPLYKSYKHLATKKGKDPYILAVVNKEGKIALCLNGNIDGMDEALKTVMK